MAIQEIANKIDLVGQTGSISTSPLYVVGPIGAGVYLAAISVLVTSPGTAGTITVGLSWNNGVTSAGFDTATFSLQASGEQSALLGNFYATNSQIITYNTTVTGATGNPVYTLRIRLLNLG